MGKVKEYYFSDDHHIVVLESPDSTSKAAASEPEDTHAVRPGGVLRSSPANKALCLPLRQRAGGSCRSMLDLPPWPERVGPALCVPAEPWPIPTRSIRSFRWYSGRRLEFRIFGQTVKSIVCVLDPVGHASKVGNYIQLNNTCLHAYSE